MNLGPLMYHWADAHTYQHGEEVSIELCLEDIERLAARCGLAMLSKEMVPACFNQDPRQAAIFHKPADPDEPTDAATYGHIRAACGQLATLHCMNTTLMTRADSRSARLLIEVTVRLHPRIQEALHCQ